MNLAIGLAIGIFVLVWIWIAFEMYHAPEYDENGFKIKEDKNFQKVHKQMIFIMTKVRVNFINTMVVTQTI